MQRGILSRRYVNLFDRCVNLQMVHIQSGPVCWAYCDDGYDDHGATCYQNLIKWYWKDTYGRGVGKIPDVCPSNYPDKV